MGKNQFRKRTTKVTTQPSTNNDEQLTEQQTTDELDDKYKSYLHAKIIASIENRKPVSEERKLKDKHGKIIPGARKNLVIRKKKEYQESTNESTSTTTHSVPTTESNQTTESSVTAADATHESTSPYMISSNEKDEEILIKEVDGRSN